MKMDKTIIVCDVCNRVEIEPGMGLRLTETLSIPGGMKNPLESDGAITDIRPGCLIAFAGLKATGHKNVVFMETHGGA